MKFLLLKSFKSRLLSPWWILVIDLAIVGNTFILAYLTLPDTSFSLEIKGILTKSIWVILFYLIAYLISNSYKGIIRHSGYYEFRKIFESCFGGVLMLFAVNELFFQNELSSFRISRHIIILHFLLTVIFTLTFRILVKEIFSLITKKHATVDAFIYGAGEMGQISMEAINNDKETRYNVVGFIDDDPGKWNIRLQNRPVMSWKKALSVAEKKDVKVIILAINDISVKRKQEISTSCLNRGWKLKVMPTVRNWIDGLSNQNQIRDIKIEDILGREEIKLNQQRIMEGLEGKVILVTGAAGSIGSEIVRQLLRFPVKKVIMLDIAESSIYDLQQELILNHVDKPFEVILADVTNFHRMKEVFDSFRPQIIFNAAAYKHVPLMEAFPYEAIRVNIGGTKILADLAIQFEVEKFVMVSTDKAVNPTNVMGTSKRICEIYIQALSQLKSLKPAFITTRFGNVLGSNGSVVPLFKKQIIKGGPLTVTHKDITRFFMTIPEACQLVLEAGFMGKGGEILVFDMGEPVKIYDLAKAMIRLSGLKIDEDIKIIFTGLRPGEKLYEELLACRENTLPTHHEKIMIGKVIRYEYDSVNQKVEEMLKALKNENDKLLVARMKELVPEYKSENSLYCELDRELVETNFE
ncbi:nucleoside-diphosphate sugar epimerase/dehydratase [Marinilabilia sp.]|uniref:polysaccharide biosynthesis protein n=1 Tax=Marinilabilia sp. TaxID=2021252 RepID=UPI0025B8BDE6|nr:nucleoside-diphosphate sugar epimerase/dehydratase [Marinilabilia sp.]